MNSAVRYGCGLDEFWFPLCKVFSFVEIFFDLFLVSKLKTSWRLTRLLHNNVLRVLETVQLWGPEYYAVCVEKGVGPTVLKPHQDGHGSHGWQGWLQLGWLGWYCTTSMERHMFLRLTKSR